MSRKQKRGVIPLEPDSSSDKDENELDEISTNERQKIERLAAIESGAISEKAAFDKSRKQCDEADEDDEEVEEAPAYANDCESTPLRPPRPSRLEPMSNVPSRPPVDQASPSSSTTSSQWKKYVPGPLKKIINRNQNAAPSPQIEDTKQPENNGKPNGAPQNQKPNAGFFGRFRRRNSTESEDEDVMEVLRPDWKNRFDIADKSKRDAREKRDRKALRRKIREQLREAERQDAIVERKRKQITDAIELLLQLLRMMASFAILVGNIRKTFIPAQFKYLKPGQHAYDNYELLLLFRCTTFLDISMFYTNVMYVYCLQWRLCCRLGFTRFVFWATILGVVSTTVMFMPMATIMNDVDLSWCRLLPNTTFAKYQPEW